MRELSHPVFVQHGNSDTLCVPNQDKHYLVKETWEGSRLLNSTIVAGPFDTDAEAMEARKEYKKNNK